MPVKGSQLKPYLCKVCGEINPDNFYQKNKMKSMCKKCHTAHSHQAQRNLKPKAIEYLGGKCTHCEQSFASTAVYDFHHIDPTEKEFNWGNKRTSNWENLKKELDKCILLCSNCHRMEHERIWLDSLQDSHPAKIKNQ